MSMTERPPRRLPLRSRKDGRVPPIASAAPTRDPANELYDRACDVLLAAQGLGAAAAQAGSASAIAAALGCIDASLTALADGAAAMRTEATRQLSRAHAAAPQSVDGIAVDGAQREFAQLVDALTTAQGAADTTRERIGPTLARLTLA